MRVGRVDDGGAVPADAALPDRPNTDLGLSSPVSGSHARGRRSLRALAPLRRSAPGFPAGASRPAAGQPGVTRVTAAGHAGAHRRPGLAPGDGRTVPAEAAKARWFGEYVASAGRTSDGPARSGRGAGPPLCRSTGGRLRPAPGGTRPRRRASLQPAAGAGTCRGVPPHRSRRSCPEPVGAGRDDAEPERRPRGPRTSGSTVA